MVSMSPLGNGKVVMAGLDPAIHAFRRPQPRRGCADQVRARRLKLFRTKPKHALDCRPNFPRTALRSPEMREGKTAG